MRELPRLVFSSYQPQTVPLILVGQALENQHPVSRPHSSIWDDRPVQLYTVRVRVEHVLQGEEMELPEISVFYYMDMGAYTGGVGHLFVAKGNHEIFLLRKDRAQWRTICDGWESCVFQVKTGAHPGFFKDPNLSVEEQMVSLIMSRGEHTSDEQMIDIIRHPRSAFHWGWNPLIKQTQKIAQSDPSPAVRAEACKLLNGYPKTPDCFVNKWAMPEACGPPVLDEERKGNLPK
jgi:hypothetical protein